jgi:hypothetical protein
MKELKRMNDELQNEKKSSRISLISLHKLSIASAWDNSTCKA